MTRGELALQHPPESLRPTEATELLRQVYGRSGTLRRLRTEKDDTFVVDAEDGRLLLKVANPYEDPAVTHLQAAALDHVARLEPYLPVQKVRPTRSGALTGTWASGGASRTAMLLEFREGEPMTGLRDWSDELLADAGRSLARLSIALADFAHPAAERDDLLWDIRRLGDLGHLVDGIGDLATQQWLRETITDLAGPLDELAFRETQVSHHDFHPGNLLVDPAAPDRVTGIIDFGDMCSTPVVADLAVALAYTVTAATGLARTTPMLRGFLELRFLTDDDLVLLPDLIRARLALTVILPMWKASLRPDQAELELRNVGPRADALRVLGAMAPGERRAAILAAARADGADR